MITINEVDPSKQTIETGYYGIMTISPDDIKQLIDQQMKEGVVYHICFKCGCPNNCEPINTDGEILNILAESPAPEAVDIPPGCALLIIKQFITF